jgi:hypothetical protein
MDNSVLAGNSKDEFVHSLSLLLAPAALPPLPPLHVPLCQGCQILVFLPNFAFVIANKP